jgi:hypothetical protein
VSAGRVTVPLIEKFCSSRGPIASLATVLLLDLLAVGAVLFCASVGIAPNHRPAAKTAIPTRLAALIKLRSAANRAVSPARRPPMPRKVLIFKHSLAERIRTRR